MDKVEKHIPNKGDIMEYDGEKYLILHYTTGFFYNSPEIEYRAILLSRVLRSLNEINQINSDDLILLLLI